MNTDDDMIDPTKSLCGALWAGLAIALWAGSLVMLRLGVTTSLNAYDLTALRFGTAAVILAPVLFTDRFGSARIGTKNIVGMVAGFGAPYLALVSLALGTAPASAAGSLNPGVMAVASVVLGWWFFGDRLGAAQTVGCGAVLLGASFTAGLTGGATLTPGHLLLVVTGIMWASYAVIVRKTRIAALPAAAVVAVGSAFGYLPIYLAVLPRTIMDAPIRDVLIQAAFQGVLVSVVALYGFNRSLELLGPVVGSTLPALIPLATVGLGALVLAEPANFSEIAAATLIGFGVGMLLLSRVFIRRDSGKARAARGDRCIPHLVTNVDSPPRLL